MGCEALLNGAAGLFHCGYFSGVSIGVVSKMSYTQKLATNMSDGMPILARGYTNLAEASHHHHHLVNIAMWLVADEGNGKHSRDPPESSGASPAKYIPGSGIY